MAIFAVSYRYSDDVAARDTHRPEHREFLAQCEGLLLSGPLSDPAGALLLVAADSAEQVEQRLDGDPFRREGVIVERVVRSYDPVLGSLADAVAAHR